MLLCRLVEGGPQIEAKLRAYGGQKVVRRVAARVVQVASGVLRQMNDLVVFIDNNGRWSVLLEQALMQICGRQPLARSLFGVPIVPLLRLASAGGRQVGRRYRKSPAHRATLEEVCILIEGHEEIARPFGRLRRPEEEETLRVQREVRDFHDSLLRGLVQINQ